MKHRIYQIFAAGMVCCGMAAALTACSNDDYLGGHYTTEGAGTILNVTAQTDKAWADGDIIGIAAGYGQNDGTARNREYVYQADASSFTNKSGYPIYVKGTTSIVAYYPFVGTDGAEPTIILNTLNQTQVTDYYFAKVEDVTRQTSEVNLVFKHALAEVTLKITTPTDESIKSCRLSGFAQKAAVNPYTLDKTLEAPEDLVVNGTNLKTITLKLIPQALSADGAVKPQLVLIGNIRSYTIDMSDLQLEAGTSQEAIINVTDGIGTVDFIPGGSQWEDSGAGGAVKAQ